MRLCVPILLAAAVAVAVAVPADGRQAPAPWATVNLCDTLDRPNQIGIRGSMPGLARRARMAMRFRVQFRDADGRWRTDSRADSGFQPVATARGGEHDAGWTFEFRPPRTGGAVELRGVVQFTWRRGARVVGRDKRFTEAGHPGTAGAEPADFSAETCAIA